MISATDAMGEPPTVFCSSCGERLGSGSRFCRSCGAELSDFEVPDGTGVRRGNESDEPGRPSEDEAVALATADADGDSRSRKWLFAGALGVVIAAGLAGVLLTVGGGKAGDRPSPRGVQAMFVQTCGRCHAFRPAGTRTASRFGSTAGIAENVGPALDDFAGLNSRLIVNAIERGRARGMGTMPPGLANHSVALKLARYIVAAAPPRRERRVAVQTSTRAIDLFTKGNAVGATACGACHSLAAARTASGIGPDLDTVVRGQTLGQIRESITRPQARITSGYPENVMPPNYAQLLSKTEVEALALLLWKPSKSDVVITHDPSGGLAFDPPVVSARAGLARIEVVNLSGIRHSIVIPGLARAAASTGSHGLSVRLRPGTYRFYCDVPGHREAGEVGRLIVRR